MDFGVSGKALAPSAHPRVNSANNARTTPVKRTAASRPDTADEVAVGSGLMGSGLDDVGLENQCRLQYARWIDLKEYVSANGEPDYWPSGLIKVRAQLLLIHSPGR
jgi:hypothetical protein